MPNLDRTPNAQAIDTTLNIDTNQQLIVVEQRNDRFALKPDVVRLPWHAVKVLAAQLTLIEAGMMQVDSSGVAGQGGGSPQDASAARPALRVN